MTPTCCTGHAADATKRVIHLAALAAVCLLLATLSSGVTAQESARLTGVTVRLVPPRSRSSLRLNNVVPAASVETTSDRRNRLAAHYLEQTADFHPPSRTSLVAVQRKGELAQPSTSEALTAAESERGAAAEEVDRPSADQPAQRRAATTPSATLDQKAIHLLTVDIDHGASSGKELEFPKNVASSFFDNQPTVVQKSEFVAPNRHLIGLAATTTGARHMPLYFEEEQLERFGTSRGLLQPAVSGAHFFGNLIAMPYKMVVEPPRQTRYYEYPYETGRAAPRYLRPYPLRVDAGVVQAAVVVGLIVLIP